MKANKERKRLLRLIREKALFYQSATLASGKKSSYYIDGKQITLSPKGSYLVAKVVLDIIKDDGIQAIGGPTIGADPIVGAVVCLSQVKGSPVAAFVVRKEAKKHGMQRYIEGPPLKEGLKVAIIDDVVTTGGSVLRAAKAAADSGCKVVRVIALVDRLEGAKENLEQHGFKLTPVFTVEELDVPSVNS